MDLEQIIGVNDSLTSQSKENTCRFKPVIKELGLLSIAKSEKVVLGCPNKHNYFSVCLEQNEVVRMHVYKYSIVSSDELIAPFVRNGFFKNVEELTDF